MRAGGNKHRNKHLQLTRQRRIDQRQTMATSTTKRQRKYAQDFSKEAHGQKTDQSFTDICNVNNIIQFYENSGVVMGSPDDPLANRIQHGEQGEASEISFEEAMRNKAAFDSYCLENPDWDQTASEPTESPQDDSEPGPTTDPDPAPQDATGGE